jgi:O-antigen ligase
MPTSSPKARQPIAFLIIALLLLLGAGGLVARQQYLTRGISSKLPQPIAHGGAEVGLNVSLEQYDDSQLRDALRRISDTGIRNVKQTFYFKDPFDWSKSDRLFAALGRTDLEVSVLLDGDPSRNFAPPQALADYASWTGEFARRYGDQVRFYFIWDEPNLSSHWGLQPVNAAEYAALLAAAVEAIRAADYDAVIVTAPLAPTTEAGPENLSDVRYLQELYEAGGAAFFDVAAGKPYGFHSGPYDRTVSLDVLLHEVMQENGDENKALFAGNWGWNSLPADWPGPPSIWGQTDGATRIDYTKRAVERARREWPWIGLMFLEAWQVPAPANDPRHGFDIQGSTVEPALPDLLAVPELAYPGFHLASTQDPAQVYRGEWQFSAQFGADIGNTGDTLSYHFWGSSAGLRVRRADYRARLYVSVDGEPAPALPDDGNGAALVLTAPDPAEDPHVLTIEAYRGWDQWALNGISVGYFPDTTFFSFALAALSIAAALLILAAIRDARRLSWATIWHGSAPFADLSERTRLALTIVMAALVTLTGWLTWGEQAAGIYRRLPDGSQLVLTAAAASIFYVAPAFFVYVLALVILFFLVYARPAWGLALAALFFPFYVLPKPVGSYRFSPVEIFVLLTAAATFAASAVRLRRAYLTSPDHQVALTALARQIWPRVRKQLVTADFAAGFFVLVATLSLLFTERLGVAQNEWRVVIVEPVLLYLLLRLISPSKGEMWTILDAFVLGGIVVAGYGLWQYALGQNVITVGGGLARLRSIYGSPNNVALYLGRILPFLFAMLLMGRATRLRRVLYGLALVPVGLSLILTFSKGALFLGVPAGLGLVFILWLRSTRRALWPWVVGAMLLLIAGGVAALSVPGLAGRLDLQGTTSVLRLSLWHASVNMFLDHPLFGVGLDNFLYAYRGRYILESGWEEPNLNHPHNIVLDFATRLGIAGLIAGVWLLAALIRNLWRLPECVNAEWKPVAIAIAGSCAQMLAHGLVDHSFFLVDLAFAFFLLLGLSVWLRQADPATIGS